LYDYTGRTEKELNLKKGQRIVVLEKMDSGWWSGEGDGKRGLFPGSYVKELQSNGRESPPRQTTPPGSLITPAIPVALKGPGPRPSSLVSTPSLSSPSLLSSPTTPPSGPDEKSDSGETKTLIVAKALFDFTGDGKKKMNLKRGDIVKVRQTGNPYPRIRILFLSGMSGAGAG
jgi:hypothetical protein